MVTNINSGDANNEIESFWAFVVCSFKIRVVTVNNIYVVWSKLVIS